MTEQELRPMTEADLVPVLQWRNDPGVRDYMYTSHIIGLNEHRNWFFAASKNPAINLLIYEYYGQACGFVNITRTRCSVVADWGFYLSPDAKKGAGRSLGEAALTYAFEVLELHKLSGEALGFNKRSIAFHRALGFIEEGRLRDQYFDGAMYQDVVCFGLLKPEWQARIKE
jgi:UDP-4-amino-4,6-dideoxy-N-acetyl-beta-L-altrosamine N-acetyltransferase